MFTEIELANGGKTRCHISLGGPMRGIIVGGKLYQFEMHHYCGPVLLHRRTGEPLKHQPMPFLEAASLWAQQGQKIDETGLCVWFREPKPITKHLWGRNFEVTGYEPAERGQ
jgi:hypothetical protein